MYKSIAVGGFDIIKMEWIYMALQYDL